jgi:hypothetical protein
MTLVSETLSFLQSQMIFIIKYLMFCDVFDNEYDACSKSETSKNIEFRLFLIFLANYF